MSSAPLRVGSVPYLVGRPLDQALAQARGIELSHDVPATLVERLRRGEVDVALVSSIELFRQPGYRYLDGLAVAGRGFVGSVQLFLERDSIDEVRTIALDPASRTARTLTRVLLAERADGGPTYQEVPLDEDPRAAGCDAWLRIGDVALREHLLENLPHWNPSEHWARTSGLPFVFAPWIVRPGVDLTPHAEAFLRAAEEGQANLDQLATEAAEAWRLPVEGCRTYLTEECIYSLEEDEMHRSLYAFRDGAARLGLCDGGLAPTPIHLGELHA